MCSNTESAQITISTTQIVYLYQSRNLIISYSVAIFACLVAVLFGGHAFYRNGVSHDASVSTFATTTQEYEVCTRKEVDEGLANAKKVRNELEKYPGGAEPLNKGLRAVSLRFRSGEGFVVHDS
jgi:hypothetical protein